jgi:hypothetical protein
VGLTSRFTSGWPWPESSWGLDPMYGVDGWCHGCGTPQVPQIAGLILQGSKFPTSAFWMPNWQFDVLCVRTEPARQIISTFRLTTMPVTKPQSEETGVVQLIPEVSSHPWFDRSALSDRVRARHGGPGAECPTCSVWRWFPLPTADLPSAAVQSNAPFVASPEWFGDGYSSFRELRFSRALAEALVSLNPRVWSMVEPQS